MNRTGEILPYRTLLWLLQVHFWKRTFTAREASSKILAFFKPADPQGLLSPRFRPKLISNGLRRLKSWELVDRRKVKREATTTTLAGKKFNRGFQYLYWITRKGFNFLSNTKGTVIDFESLADALVNACARTLFKDHPLSQLAVSLNLIPKTWTQATKRRLPNAITSKADSKYLADLALTLLKEEMERLLIEAQKRAGARRE